MAVTHDYKCPKHGYFESKKAQCPMKDCHEEVLLVFLQAPNMVSAKTRFTDKSTKQLAIEFGMSNIKTAREGENQAGYLTRNNKFSEKEYSEAEKYATRKKGNKDKIMPTPQIEAHGKPVQVIMRFGVAVFKGLVCKVYCQVEAFNPLRVNRLA